MTGADKTTEAAQPGSPGIVRVDRPVRPASEARGLLAQIEACRREVAQWPEWMRTTRTAPAWMEGWDA